MKALYYGSLWLGLFLLYTAVQNPGYLDISDAQERFAATLALVKTGRPMISTFFRPEPFAPIYSIGPGLAALPFFALGKLWMLTGLTDMPERQVMLWMTLHGVKVWTALWMCLISAMAGLFGASRRSSLMMALGVGLCTLVLPYSKTFQSENLVGLWISTLVYALIRWRRRGNWRWLPAAGAAYGMALTTKLELAVLAPLLAAWMLAACRNGGTRALIKSWLLFGAAVMPGVAIVLWYNWLRFGGIFTDGYESQGFTHPLFSGLFLIWLSPGKGLFWYCPLLLVSVPLIPRLLRRLPMDASLAVGMVLVMNLLYAKWHSPTGETSLGARFMVSYLPLLMLPLLELSHLPRWSPRRIAAGLTAAAGLILNLLFCSVSFVLYHSRRWNNAPNDPLERMRAVWENWYVPAHSPVVGMQQLLREGLLDLYFIRFLPLEHFLMVQPALYWILFAAFTAIASAGVVAMLLERAEQQKPVRTYMPALLGTLAFACLIGASSGILKGERPGLRAVFERKDFAHYETRSLSIAVNDFQESAAFHIMGGADFTATWTGTFEAKKAGSYEFRLKAVNTATLTINGQQVASATGKPFTIPTPVLATLHLQPGRHRIRVKYQQPEIQGQVELKWRSPGEQHFRSLRNGNLRPG